VSLVSINVWRLAGDSLNITCNFLCCNHQVHRDFLITLYLHGMSEEMGSVRYGVVILAIASEIVIPNCTWFSTVTPLLLKSEETQRNKF
jgi:hypothetical protein